MLLWIINRKSHTCFRVVTRLTTLVDLELTLNGILRFVTLQTWLEMFGAHHKNLNEDRSMLSTAKCIPRILSSNIRILRIIAGVCWRGASHCGYWRTERSRGVYDSALYKSTFTYLLTYLLTYTLIQRPRSGWPRLNFGINLISAKIRVFGLSARNHGASFVRYDAIPYRPWAANTFRSTVNRTNRHHH